MAKFEAGNDPAEHTVSEVVEFLKGEDATPDEYDRVMQAEREREGGGRLGIINLSGTEPDPAPVAPDETPEAPPADPAPVAPLEETEDDDEAPAPQSAEDAVRQAQARIDARRGRNYDEVLQTRGDRPHGE
jgi:hypothetical protein